MNNSLLWLDHFLNVSQFINNFLRSFYHFCSCCTECNYNFIQNKCILLIHRSARFSTVDLPIKYDMNYTAWLFSRLEGLSTAQENSAGSPVVVPFSISSLTSTNFWKNRASVLENMWNALSLLLLIINLYVETQTKLRSGHEYMASPSL